MSAFPYARYISSWARLSPGSNEKCRKEKSVHINRANPYLKGMLCEVTWKRNTYRASWCWKEKQRKETKRVAITLSRKLLAVICIMLKTNSSYDKAGMKLESSSAGVSGLTV